LIAGAPCPEQIIKRIHAEMNCNIIVSYGATETSGGVTYTSFADNTWVSSKTVGRVVQGTQIKIVDGNRQEVPIGTIGELACRGTGIMKGYFEMSEVTQKAVDAQGWFYTGDLAKMDSQGYITIVERKKNMIIRGGYNIYPRDVEEILFTHPHIATAVVVGIPDTVLGEVTCAVIQLISANDKDIADTMKNYIRERVAKYKVPDHILFVESFPLTPTGKIDKKTLRTMCKNQLKSVLR
jgi:acyl-CoA synthetase (AMP-forming)/AMP-acid ligase II